MTPFEHEETKRRPQARLAAMRRRARRLRQRVLVGTGIGFGLFWMVIFAQMITGHDPALESTAASVRAKASPSRPERRSPEASPPGEDGEVSQRETAHREEERLKAAALEAERLEAEASVEAEELEAVTTGQS